MSKIKKSEDELAKIEELCLEKGKERYEEKDSLE